jgi:inorganic phosphate transporter, PiT family
MFGLDTTLTVLLIICLLCACFFEFINGFHDTANAVATVIYTNSLKPTVAVVYSGLLNFLGVMLGGIAVAMGIVNLLPVDVLIDANPYHGVAMILALLLSAIIWNFGTWYFGIPSSSSHTIIGSILGIGLAFYFLPGNVTSSVNWDKALETGQALLISPLLGFSMAIILMFLFKRFIKNDIIYKEPIPGKKPPLWVRILLWITCGLVSFFHGQNDGQKGVGLIMLILIAILPGLFALDASVNLQNINSNVVSIETTMKKVDVTALSLDENKMYADVLTHLDKFKTATANKTYATDVALKNRFDLRKNIVVITKNTDKLLAGGNLKLSSNETGSLKKEIKAAKKLIEYAPMWVIIVISLCLALGTMIGWKRIVKTVGEKIGKQHMSYAQGASAEIVASIGIGLASFRGVPVSTTHMLSSGIAGSMVAKKGLKNLQKGTIKTIALTWVFTVPVTIILSGSLFLLFRAIL